MTDESAAERIAVSFPKGGTAKSFTAFNLAGALDYYGFETLLIDFDQTGTLTSDHNLGHLEEDESLLSIDELLLDDDTWHRLPEVIVTREDSYDIIPRNDTFSDTKKSLVSEFKSDMRLDSLLEIVDDVYDYIIIDCHPSEDIYVRNALVAAKQVVIPNLPKKQAMTSTGQMMSFFDELGSMSDWEITPLAALLTNIPRAQEHGIHEEVQEWFEEMYGDNGFVLPMKKAFEEPLDVGECIHTHKPARREEGFEEFDGLVRHVIEQTNPDYPMDELDEVEAVEGGRA